MHFCISSQIKFVSNHSLPCLYQWWSLHRFYWTELAEAHVFIATMIGNMSCFLYANMCVANGMLSLFVLPKRAAWRASPSADPRPWPVRPTSDLGTVAGRRRPTERGGQRGGGGGTPTGHLGYGRGRLALQTAAAALHRAVHRSRRRARREVRRDGRPRTGVHAAARRGQHPPSDLTWLRRARTKQLSDSPVV